MSKITDGFEERAFYADNWTKAYLDLEVRDLLQHARALEAMLRKLDEKRFDRVDNCPICGDYRRHSLDCELAKLME